MTSLRRQEAGRVGRERRGLAVQSRDGPLHGCVSRSRVLLRAIAAGRASVPIDEPSHAHREDRGARTRSEPLQICAAARLWWAFFFIACGVHRFAGRKQTAVDCAVDSFVSASACRVDAILGLNMMLGSNTSDVIGRSPALRKIIAVVYADMVGFSRLIGPDDIGTIERIRRLRTESIDPAIRAWLQDRCDRGDPMLMVFSVSRTLLWPAPPSTTTIPTKCQNEVSPI
jgi:hypothetical protein